MTGRRWWLLPSAAGAVLACQDAITAPGVCPDFCPQGSIVILDTLLTNSVTPLGSYEGYRLPNEAQEAQVVGPGGPAESRALMVFARFGQTYAGGDTSVHDTIVQTDSLRFTFNVLRRNRDVRGLVLALHQIPITTDTTATYARTAPYFEDSTLVATLAVPDTFSSGRISVTVPVSALQEFVADTFQSAIGLRISSPDPAFVSIGTSDTIQPAVMTRFVRVDTSNGSKIVTRGERAQLTLRTFVVDTSQVPPPQGFLVGGVAAARAYLKLNLDTAFLDTTVIVRATLVFSPLAPPFGAPGDTFRLRVQALGTDFTTFGPKSPLIVQAADSGRTSNVPVGTNQTVSVDLTDILRAWQGASTLPHNVMLRVVPEAASIDRLELAPGVGSQAVLRITYGLPFKVPGR